MTDTIGHHSSFHTVPATRSAGTRPVARLALSCGLASALALGAAATATAAQHSDEGKQRRDAASDGAHAGSRHHPPAGSPAQRGGRASSANRPSSERASAPSGRSHAPSATSHAPSGTSHAPSGASQRHGQAGTRGTAAARAQHNPADPAGNNGTIKVDGLAYDDGVDNEPHVSCEVRVTFFGFDEGQTADITFTGQAPTGGGVLLHEGAVPTSDDAAGGAGQDADGATRVYTVDDLGLSGVTPHPKQGYHVKVSVDSLGAPGGAKQKVLWIEPCGDTADSQVPAAPGQLPAVPPAGPVVEQVQPAQAAVAALTWEQAAGAAVAPGEAAVAMAPTRAVAPTSAPSSGSPSVALSSLPHTGVDGLGALLLTGLGALAAGGALQLARRRRLSTTS